MEFADHRQEVKANTMKSEAFDTKPVAFDTKSNGNYVCRKSIKDR